MDFDNLSRIMAVDYGTRRIGLALTDPLMTFAYPYQTIFNDDKLWQNLLKIIEEMGVNKIILGYPLKESGDKSSSTSEVEKFHVHLKEKFKDEVILWDERYTSVIAKENILKSVNKKQKRRDKGLLDQNSAAIILQEYLRSIGR
jgi:putative Holliday junction resolvase